MASFITRLRVGGRLVLVCRHERARTNWAIPGLTNIEFLDRGQGHLLAIHAVADFDARYRDLPTETGGDKWPDNPTEPSGSKPNEDPPRTSRVSFLAALGLTDAQCRETDFTLDLKNHQSFWLRFVWPCPLSPFGQGYFVRLILRAVLAPHTGLEVEEDLDPNIKGSLIRIWDGRAWQRSKIDFQGAGQWHELDQLWNRPFGTHRIGWHLDDIPLLRTLSRGDPAQGIFRIDKDEKRAEGNAWLVFRTAWHRDNFVAGDETDGPDVRGRVVALVRAKSDNPTWTIPFRSQALTVDAESSWNLVGFLRFMASEPAPRNGTGPWLLAVQIKDLVPVPTRAGELALTPSTFYARYVARPHHVGLRSLRGRRRTSLLPLEFPLQSFASPLPHHPDLKYGELDGFRLGWWLRFQVPLSADDWPIAATLTALVAPPTKVTVSPSGVTIDALAADLTFPQVRTMNARALVRRALVASPDTDPLRPTVLADQRFETVAAGRPAVFAMLVADRPNAPAELETRTVILGAIAIEFADRVAGAPAGAIGLDDGDPFRGSMTARLRSLPDRPTPAYTLSADLRLAVACAGPGGQDPRVRDAGARAGGLAEMPIVFPIAGLGALGENVVLRVDERADADTNHVVDLKLTKQIVDADEDEAARDVDVALIDPAPFMVARLRGMLVPPDGEIIASLRWGAEYGGFWELASGDQDAVGILFAPQVIGEEMIKGTIFDSRDGRPVPVPDPDDMPLDFRLGPPTRLLLDRSMQPRARTIAPWNLRRILEAGSAEAPGLRLLALEAELLYGLSFLMTSEDMRVTELEGWAGRFALPSDIRDTTVTSASRGLPDSRVLESYRALVDAWMRSLRFRVGHLQPYRRVRNVDNTGTRVPESYRDGIRHRFRPNRATADPFQPEAFAIARGNAPTPDGRPLHGGVDWLFEAEPVYEEVLQKPDSTSSELGNLSLTALGGTGVQKAAFARDKTIISSATEQGRTRRVTLERIGRISMLWTRAKHVIVYERTVKTPDRYRPSEPPLRSDQPREFEGLAMMRKVREYIEILQPTRDFPDFGETTRYSGCLLSNRFETIKIDVLPEWGFNTETGWAMPLAGPVPENKRAFYPRPDVFLKLARASASGGGVWHQIRSLERLLFYTSVRPDDGADTDAWAPVPDIDFPLLNVPRAPAVRHDGAGAADPQNAQLAPMASDADGKLPDPPDVEPGYDRFTVDLYPADETVNLGHGRPGEGIEAHVSNVCLARSKPGTIEAGGALDLAQGYLSLAGAGDAQLHDAMGQIATLAARATTAGTVTDSDRRHGALAAKSALTQLDTLIGAIGADPKLKALLDTGGFDWAGEQKKLKARWLERLGQVGDTLRDAILSELKLANLGNLDEAAGRFSRRVEESFVRLRTEIESVEFVGDIVHRQVRRGIVVVAANVRAQADRVAGDLKSLAAKSTEGLEADDDGVIFVGEAFARTVRPRLADARALVKRAVGSVGSLMRTELDDLLPKLGDQLAGILEEMRLAIDDVFDAIDAQLGDATGMIDLAAISAEIDRLMKEIPLLLEEGLGDQASQLVDVLLAPVLAAVRAAQRTVLDLLEETRTALLELIATASDAADLKRKLEGGIRDGIGSVVDRAKHELGDKLGNWANDAKQGLKDLQSSFADMQAALEARRAELEALRNQILNGLAGDVLTRLRTIEKDMAAVGSAWRPITDLVRAATSRDLLKGNPLQIADRSLRLARAFGDAPITEALDFTRDRLAYYFDPIKDVVDVTPVATLFNRVGSDVANALGLRQPFGSIGDRFLPDFGDSFDFRKMLPDFAGLKLDDLLPGLRVPGRKPEWITIKHGFDKNARKAWASAVIDVKISGEPHLFDAGPLSLILVEPRFEAHSRVETDIQGTTRTETKGALGTDLVMNIGGQPLVTFRKARLHFENGGQLQLDIDPTQIEVAAAMQFITDLLKSFVGEDTGFQFTPLPEGGISTRLDLPLPDLTGAVFSITSLLLHSRLDFLFAGRFTIRSAFWLSRPNRPFNLSVLFLGGGGWVGVESTYSPPSDIEVRVSIGIAAGATAALNLGVATGIVQFLISLSADFYKSALGGQVDGPRLTLGLLTFGELRVLGLISVYIGIGYEVSYNSTDGSLTGRGWLSVRIKICWCVTIKVERSVSVRMAGSGKAKKASAISPARARAARSAADAHLATLAVE
jgi:hypothetical protein